jgi:hypothetical protein
MVQPARRLGRDREGERRREDEQRDHDGSEQTHGRSLFVGKTVSPSTQSALYELRPFPGVRLEDNHSTSWTSKDS